MAASQEITRPPTPISQCPLTSIVMTIITSAD